jgi:hypothetical protein
MKTLKIAALCAASMLVASMALAGSAFAAPPLWLLCLNRGSGGNYVENQCRSLHDGAGAWESEGIPAGGRETAIIRGFSLRLEDDEVKTTLEKAVVKCNGTGSEGEGEIISAKEGIIREAKVAKAEEHCERVEGPCQAGKVEKVEGADMPWKQIIFETENKTMGALRADGNGEPGWAITCKTLLGSKTDTCTSRVSEGMEPETLTLVNEVTGGVLLVRGVFNNKALGTCTEGNKPLTAQIHGLVAILLPSGNGLSINLSI